MTDQKVVPFRQPQAAGELSFEKYYAAIQDNRRLKKRERAAIEKVAEMRKFLRPLVRAIETQERLGTPADPLLQLATGLDDAAFAEWRKELAAIIGEGAGNP